MPMRLFTSASAMRPRVSGGTFSSSSPLRPTELKKMSTSFSGVLTWASCFAW